MGEEREDVKDTERVIKEIRDAQEARLLFHKKYTEWIVPKKKIPASLRNADYDYLNKHVRCLTNDEVIKTFESNIGSYFDYQYMFGRISMGPEDFLYIDLIELEARIRELKTPDFKEELKQTIKEKIDYILNYLETDLKQHPEEDHKYIEEAREYILGFKERVFSPEWHVYS